jgi:hypothetical protein
LLSLQGLDSIHDQINEGLLNLNLIDRDRREGLFEVALDGYGALSTTSSPPANPKYPERNALTNAAKL